MSELENSKAISTQGDLSKFSLAFLGICERANVVLEGNGPVTKLNVMGLKSVVGAFIFPARLTGMKMAFSVFHNEGTNGSISKFCIAVVDDNDQEQGTLDFEVEGHEVFGEEKENRVILGYVKGSWSTLIVEMPETKLFLKQPGRYRLFLVSDLERVQIGAFYVYLIRCPSLTDDRIAALRSDPHSKKTFALQMTCSKCLADFTAYVSVDRSKDLESKGYVWYSELPDQFKCECGETNIELSYLRQNMHSLLLNQRDRAVELASAPLYEKTSLEDLVNRFRTLINEGVEEERYQRFIQDNPVVLHQFSADQLMFKSKILTKQVTDFAVLTHSKELILIEIEKPTTRLLKSDGGLAAEVQHAFDQVRDWLYTVDHHRAAVLDCMGLESKDVSKITGVVIAGRDIGQDPEHLRRLKSYENNRIKFYTFDDLLGSLIGITRNFDRL